MKNRYWVLLALVFLVGLDRYIRAPDSRSRQLSAAIEAKASPKLKAYPYGFRVLRVSGDIAFLGTPRNYDVPAFKVLAVLYPGMNTKDANNPEFIAAEQLLGEVQSEARSIVQAEPGVREVRWELDREWLSAHYIEVPSR